jgi:hypothetical protein
MAHLEIIPHHSNDGAAAAHAIANIAMELEGKARPSRIHFTYRDVRKFRIDRLEAGKFPKMLWRMLQELGYGKQLEYFGTEGTYEGSEPICTSKSTSSLPRPSEEFMRWKRSM